MLVLFYKDVKVSNSRSLFYVQEHEEQELAEERAIRLLDI
jgi:hypothetical protein